MVGDFTAQKSHFQRAQKAQHILLDFFSLLPHERKVIFKRLLKCCVLEMMGFRGVGLGRGDVASGPD